jgi:hypothetical protein
MSRPNVDLIVVMPVGPRETLDAVCDTVESVRYYSGPSRRIIVLDDSGSALGRQIQERIPEVLVLQHSSASHHSVNGKLYMGLSRAMMYALDHFDFHVLLKLDVDALMTGLRPEAIAIEHFRQHPTTGMLGSYRVDCNGDARSFGYWEARFRAEMRLHRYLISPRRRRAIRGIVARARTHGYELGENCQGGAYFISAACIQQLVSAGLLAMPELADSPIAEDIIFPLLIRSVGLELGDLATGSLPLGLRYLGLPDAPHRLLDRGKKIVHSVRFWEDMTEAQVREAFRAARWNVLDASSEQQLRETAEQQGQAGDQTLSGHIAGKRSSS